MDLPASSFHVGVRLGRALLTLKSLRQVGGALAVVAALAFPADVRAAGADDSFRPLSAYSVEELVKLLQLEPHPNGTGFFQRVYTSPQSVVNRNLPGNRTGPAERLTGTLIYSLLLPTYSALHRLKSDEVILFLAGNPLEVLLLKPDGSSTQLTVGADLRHGQVSSVVIPAGTWMGYWSNPALTSHAYTLLGAPVVPGFEYDDFEHADAEALAHQYPAHAALIRTLKERSLDKH